MNKVLQVNKKSGQLRAYTMVIVFVLLAVLLQVLTKGLFLTNRNISNLVRQMAVTSILAAGVAFPIITKNFDMSVGSMMGLLGGSCALFMKAGIGVVPSILFVLAIGFILGTLQGVLIARANIPAFIVTLGGYLAWRGTLYLITGSKAVTITNKAFSSISTTNLSAEFGWALCASVVILVIAGEIIRSKGRVKAGLQAVATGRIAAKCVVILVLAVGITILMNSYEGIPVPFLIMLAMVCIFTFVAEKTTYGRSVYAIGGNREAARYSGIPVKRNTMFAFSISGLLAGVAAVVLTARINSATPSAGTMSEMDAIAAAVIGGVSLSGGKGRVPGVVIGALIMASIDNGMSLMNVDSSWQYVIKGAVLVTAVLIDELGNKKRD